MSQLTNGFRFALQSSGLRFWRWWFAVGVVLVLSVVYLSLANIHMPQVSSTIGDKINHLIAYAVLCGWFGQLLTGKLQRIVMGLCLMLLGITMEWLQGMTAYRFFDLLDAAANCLGVLAGMLALYLGADKILGYCESRFLKAS